MPIATQFALSLEIAKLVPLQLAISKSVEAVMNLARSLQNSGSNIVVEEDLALLFGRSRISQQLESSFKTVLKCSSAVPPALLADEIVLQHGPGPTVARAMSHAAYFATVVQLSMLAWTHENNALGQAIVATMERRRESAPKDAAFYNISSQDDIAKVIRSCEEQTSSFNWNNLLMPVASTLGIRIMPAQNPIAPAVFRGLVEMLPLVQKLNEDRFIHIQTDSGICTIVVWIHHMLGMTVLVRSDKNGEVRFGSGVDQITIDILKPFSKSVITLLDSGDDIVFRAHSETDDFEIDGAKKICLKGYGTEMLAEVCPTDAIAAEVELIVTATARNVARRLQRGTLTAKRTVNNKDTENLKLDINDRTIILAANILFDQKSICDTDVQLYEKHYSTGLRNNSPFPSTIMAYQTTMPDTQIPVLRRYGSRSLSKPEA